MVHNSNNTRRDRLTLFGYFIFFFGPEFDQSLSSTAHCNYDTITWVSADVNFLYLSEEGLSTPIGLD